MSRASLAPVRSLSALPASLRPWAEPLAMFDHRLIELMGEWLPRLHNALSRAVASRPTHHGDPDGLDGLARRGSFERLLMSEWALAELEPLEFQRRVAMGEQLFLRLARTEPEGARDCVAYFDVGPWQLGRPRLVQLALMTLLYQRALDTGATFELGNLPSPDLSPFSRARVAEWLKARQWAPIAPDALACLTETQPREQWVIGADSLRAPANAAGAHHIGIVESQDGLEVTLTWADGLHRHVRLPPPSPERAVALLRNPFGSSKPSTPTPYSARGSLIDLSDDGHRLLYRTEGKLIAAHVPSRSFEVPGQAIEFSGLRDRQVVAAGLHRGKRIAAIARRDETQPFGWYDSRYGLHQALFYLPDAFQPQIGASPHPLHVLSQGRKPTSAFLDGHGRLWHIQSNEDNPHVLVSSESSVTDLKKLTRDIHVAVIHGQLAAASRWNGPPPIYFEHHGHAHHTVILGYLTQSAHQPTATVFGTTPHYLASDGDGWQLIHLQSAESTPIELQGTPLALSQTYGVILVVRNQEFQLQRVDHQPSQALTLFTTEVPLSASRWYPMCQCIAYETQDGELGVYSLRFREVVTRLPPSNQDTP